MTRDYNILNLIVVALINFIGLMVAFWVFGANKRGRINQLVFFWAIFSIMYINFGYLSELERFFNLSLFLKRLRFASVCCFFITGYYFFIYFPTKSKKNIYFEKIYIFLWAVMILLSLFSPYIIREVRLTENMTNVFFGGGINIFFLLTITSIFLLFSILFKKYFKLPGDKKLQVQHFLLGASLFAIFNLIFNIIFPLYRQDMKYFQIGDYSTIFLLGFTAYAIVKRELFGIKVVLTQFFVALIAILLLIQTILAPSIEGRLLNGGILAAFLFFGYLLIKSVLKEIKQREKIEEMAKQVQQAYEAEKRAHKIEKTAREELERLDKAKDQFLLATQHHMRTPLTSTRGFINMLLEGSFGKLKPKVKRALTISYDSIVRSIKLVNELLDVSQFQLGKEVIRVEPNVKITPILKEIVEELSFEVKEKGIYLKLNRPKEDLPLIKADHQRLKVALTNIIDNGVKYTKKGGVTVSAEVADSRILIVVKDTGMGISEKEIPLLFTRTFERGESAEKAYGPGKGIGLYLAAQIIKAHQGRVWAESEGENKGSVFYVELPL